MTSTVTRYLLFALCLAAPVARAQVNLASPASPSSAEPGVTLVTLTGSGYPSGSILPSQVNVRLAPAVADAGPTAVTVAAGVQTVVGSTRRVTFTVPASLLVAAPTEYRVSVSGSTADGATSFTTNTPAALTIQPVAGILSSVPAAIQAGQAAALLIRTQFAAFVQGAADVSFTSAAGVSIAGSVIVVDNNTLLVPLRAAVDATPGPRELVLRQGPATYRLADALTVQTDSVTDTSKTVLTTLSDATTPDNGTPGVTTFSLTVTGLPTATLAANQFRLFVEPRNDPSAVTSFTLTPAAISAPDANNGNSRTITFQVPATVSVTSLTDYLVTFYGTTSNYGALATGATFLSGNRTLVKLGPPPVEAPAITSVSPFAAQQGQTLSVTLTGRNTNFAQGQTVAAFGAGISVGGAAAGQFGPVTVTSPTSATASIAIQPGAALGSRDVEARTGSQLSASLRAGFQVLQGATVLTLTSIQPAAAQPGATVTITASGFPSGTISANAVSISLTPVRSGAGPGRTVAAASISAEGGNSTRQVTFVLPADLIFPQPENYAASISGTSASGVVFSSATPLTVIVQPLPRITTVVPNSGQRGLSVNVEINGEFTSFTSSAQVNFGAGVTVSAVNAVSPTRLTATLTIAANAAAGSRNVTVTGAGVLPNGFTVSAAPPATITLSSATVPASARAGDTVAVTASNFPAGDAVPSQVTLSIEPATGTAAPVALTATAVLDIGGGSRAIRFVIPALLAPAAGSPALNYLVSVSGANAAGVAFSSSNKSALSVQPPQVNPTLTSITPSQGAQGQTLNVAITGANTAFAQGTTQLSLGSGVTVTSVTVTSATALTAQIVIAATATPGPRNVVVTTGASQVVSLPAGFNVTASVPQISSVSPFQASQAQTVTVAIRGQNTNFASGLTTVTVSGGAGIAVSNIAVQNALSVTAQFAIASDAPLGSRTITVTTGAEVVTSSFAITAAQPTITSVTPSSALAGQSVTLAITGLNTSFSASSVVTFSGTSIAVGTVTVASPTSLTAEITIAPDAALGSRTLTVTTGQQIVTFSGFQVQAPAPGSTAVISSVTPGVGATGSTVQVTIVGSGTAFAAGTSVVSFGGAGVSPGPLTVTSPTQLSTTLTIAPDATAGPRLVTVTTGSEVASLANGFAVIGPEVTLLSPTDKSFVNTPSITVSGRVNDSSATVAVNGVAAPNVGGNFTVAIPLSEGNNTVTAVATTASGATSSTSVLVNLDTTPPRVAILTPLEGDETTEERINVAGNVNDIVVGTVNDVQAQVTVNGVPADVSNRSFVARNIPLQAGANTVQVVARDRVGNAFTASVKVNRVMAPLLKLTVVSGNNQVARINASLPQPVVVQLTDGLGIPKANTPVFFRVAGNNGRIGGALTAEVRTDAQGIAQASWTLGSRSGAGINRMEVGATGVTAPAVFTATGLPSAAARIVVDSGLNQTGAVGQKLPLPFVAVVIDEGNNRLAAVPVTLTVRSGGGKLDGQDTLTVNTDPDGRIAQTLTLGPQEGNENNEVVATFTGNTANPAIFTASGRVPKRIEDTRVSGVVLDNANQPISGVTVKLLKLNQGASSNLPLQVGVSTLTNANGYFEIAGAPVGVFKLLADGTTVQSSKRYPTIEFDITTVAGRRNSLGTPIYIPALDNSRLCVDEATGGTLTLSEAPGFALTVAPGSATFPGGSKRGCISVTPVNTENVPMSPGFGQQPRFVVTIQPVGATFNPPAALQIPNTEKLNPGSVVEMYSYDHDLGSFVSIGSGQVSSDGLQIRSSPGTGVVKAGWHCGGNPAPPDGVVADCETCKVCLKNSCEEDPRQKGQLCDDMCPKKRCVDGECLLVQPPDGVEAKCRGLVNDTLKISIEFELEAKPTTCQYEAFREKVTVDVDTCCNNPPCGTKTAERPIVLVNNKWGDGHAIDFSLAATDLLTGKYDYCEVTSTQQLSWIRLADLASIRFHSTTIRRELSAFINALGQQDILYKVTRDGVSCCATLRNKVSLVPCE